MALVFDLEKQAWVDSSTKRPVNRPGNTISPDRVSTYNSPELQPVLFTRGQSAADLRRQRNKSTGPLFPQRTTRVQVGQQGPGRDFEQELAERLVREQDARNQKILDDGLTSGLNTLKQVNLAVQLGNNGKTRVDTPQPPTGKSATATNTQTKPETDTTIENQIADLTAAAKQDKAIQNKYNIGGRVAQETDNDLAALDELDAVLYGRIQANEADINRIMGNLQTLRSKYQLQADEQIKQIEQSNEDFKKANAFSTALRNARLATAANTAGLAVGTVQDRVRLAQQESIRDAAKNDQATQQQIAQIRQNQLSEERANLIDERNLSKDKVNNVVSFIQYLSNKQK